MKFTNRDKFLIYAELAKMVKAGFGFDRSAEVLMEQASTPVQRKFATGLKKGLEKGETVSESLAKIPLEITELEVSVVQAAENSGSLEEGFAYLHDYFHSVWQTERQIRSRLIYPFVLLHLAILLPLLPKLFSGMSTLAVARQLGLSLFILYGGAALIWMGATMLRRSARANVGADRFLGLIPLIGGARRLIAWQRFCNVFGMFVRSGRKISTGLEAAGKATQSASVIRASQRLADSVRGGQQLGPAIAREKVFTRDFTRSIQSAEMTGSLDDDLRRWAAFYEQAVKEQMEKIGTLVPRFLYMLVVLFVGWQIVSFYWGQLQGVQQILDEFGT